MTNTVPTFFTLGAKAVASSPALSISPGLPVTLGQGNLLIAAMWEGAGTAPGSWTVNAPWVILTTIPAATVNMVIAYTYVRGNSNDVAPTFTNSGPSGNNLFAQVFEYANVRISTPLGNMATNASVAAAAVSCDAIAASAGNSLAILIDFTPNTSGVWPPAVGGWTLDYDPGLSNSFNLASKTLTNTGDSTGSVTTTSDTSWAIINLEVLGATQPTAGDTYFNGLRFPSEQTAAMTASNWGKFWYNGLPLNSIYKTAFIPPPPKGGGAGGKDKGKGGGGGPKAGGLQFDPYGHYAVYTESRDKEHARLRRRRNYVAALSSATYNVSISETVTATSTQSAVADYAVTVTESASASETNSLGAIVPVTQSETASPTATQSAVVVYSASTAESASALATTSVTVTFAASITESVTAVATTTAVYTANVTVTESVSATDTAVGVRVLNVTQSESVSSTATFSAVYTANVTQAESVNAAATLSAVYTTNPTVAESAGAVDVAAAVKVTNASVNESASLVDTITAGKVTNASVSESASAVDTVSAVYILGANVSESASLVDTITAVYIAAATQSEAASVTDHNSAVGIFVVGVTDTTTLVDVAIGTLTIGRITNEVANAVAKTGTRVIVPVDLLGDVIVVTGLEATFVDFVLLASALVTESGLEATFVDTVDFDGTIADENFTGGFVT